MARTFTPEEIAEMKAFLRAHPPDPAYDDEDELLEQPASVAHMASAHPAAKAERSSVVIFCECMTYHCSRKP